MDTFNENSPAILNASDDWLRRRQGLALPVIPPTTPEARRFFFSEIAKHAAAASAENKSRLILWHLLKSGIGPQMGNHASISLPKF